MNTQITSKDVLNLVEKTLVAKKFSRQVVSGVYLRNEKRKELYVSIGASKLITVYLDGELELFLKASEHTNIDQAKNEVDNFVNRIYDVLNMELKTIQ